MPLLTSFSWVGLALGWGVRRFHDNIYMFPNSTEFGISQAHYHLRGEAFIFFSKTVLERGVEYTIMSRYINNVCKSIFNQNGHYILGTQW